MSCPDIETLVREASGDLSETERLRVEDHLRRCLSCREELVRLRESWDLVDLYEVPPVAAGFTASVLRRVRSEESAAPRFRRPVIRWLAAVAATLVLGAGVGWWFARSRELAAPETPETPVAAGRRVTDEEIIRDLEVYENADLLEHLELVAELDVIEGMEDSPR